MYLSNFSPYAFVIFLKLVYVSYNIYINSARWARNWACFYIVYKHKTKLKLHVQTATSIA